MTDISHLDGMFVGQLTEDELRDFNRAVSEGRARRSYEGAGGFMGLARVKLINADQRAGGTQAEIARQFGIAQNTVSGIKRRRTWRHVP